MVGQRAGQGLALAHGLLHVAGRPLEDDVAAGLADDLQALQDRDTGAEHGAEVAAEPAQCHLLEEFPEDGQL